MNWMRAALIAMTAIGRHLLDILLLVFSARSSSICADVEPSQRYPVATGRRQPVFVQALPFSVKPYGGEFLPCQVARKPKERVPPAETERL